MPSHKEKYDARESYQDVDNTKRQHNNARVELQASKNSWSDLAREKNRENDPKRRQELPQKRVDLYFGFSH